MTPTQPQNPDPGAINDDPLKHGAMPQPPEGEGTGSNPEWPESNRILEEYSIEFKGKVTDHDLALTLRMVIAQIKPYVNRPPEDLRAEIRDLIKAAGQAELSFYDALVWEYTDYILSLCEAAALAALPEKQDERLNKTSNGPLSPPQLIDIEARGHNKAIDQYQANIHSAFGGGA